MRAEFGAQVQDAQRPAGHLQPICNVAGSGLPTLFSAAGRIGPLLRKWGGIFYSTALPEPSTSIRAAASQSEQGEHLVPGTTPPSDYTENRLNLKDQSR